MSSYYTLLVLDADCNKWCAEFGSYRLVDVKEEIQALKDSGASPWDFKTIITDDTQEAIDAEIARLNEKLAFDRLPEVEKAVIVAKKAAVERVQVTGKASVYKYTIKDNPYYRWAKDLHVAWHNAFYKARQEDIKLRKIGAR